MVTMSTGVVTIQSWNHIKDFINRYSLMTVSKYMESDAEYILIVASDGYAFQHVIVKSDPKSQNQLEFESMFGIGQ